MLDELETALILALESKSEDTRVTLENVSSTSSLHSMPVNRLLKLKEANIGSAFILSMEKSFERIYTTSTDFLLAHPSEIISDKSEVIFITEENDLRWMAFEKLNGAPKGCSTVGSVSHWYALHNRIICCDGLQDYFVQPFAMSKKGIGLPVKVGGQFIGRESNVRNFPAIVASIIEDAESANMVQVSIKSDTGVELKFPVGNDAYKELFALRDGPYSGSRKKAIIHWVSKHLRKKKDDSVSAVKEHLRGVHEFRMDCFDIKLTPNPRFLINGK